MSELALVEAQPRRVLVADDTAIWRRVVASAIAADQAPSQVTEVSTGDACMHELCSQPYDLAFIDVHMPGGSGMEALGAARFQGRDVFVVVISSDTRDNTSRLARGLKAYDFLKKPLQPEGLAAVLENYRRIKHPRAVLLVDDSATVRRIISKVLSNSVFNLVIHEAASALEAVAACKARRYDLVFLDVNMPEIDGIETLRMLRAHNPRARVCLISGDSGALERVHASRLGIQGFLKKPFYAHDVDDVLHKTLGLQLPFQN